MHKSKYSSVIAAFTATVLLFTGCNSASESNSSNENSKVTESSIEETIESTEGSDSDAAKATDTSTKETKVKETNDPKVSETSETSEATEATESREDRAAVPFAVEAANYFSFFSDTVIDGEYFLSIDDIKDITPDSGNFHISVTLEYSKDVLNCNRIQIPSANGETELSIDNNLGIYQLSNGNYCAIQDDSVFSASIGDSSIPIADNVVIYESQFMPGFHNSFDDLTPSKDITSINDFINLVNGGTTWYLPLMYGCVENGEITKLVIHVNPHQAWRD